MAACCYHAELAGAGEMQSVMLRVPEAGVCGGFEDLRLDADSKAAQEQDVLDRIEVSAPRTVADPIRDMSGIVSSSSVQLQECRCVSFDTCRAYRADG